MCGTPHYEYEYEYEYGYVPVIWWYGNGYAPTPGEQQDLDRELDRRLAHVIGLAAMPCTSFWTTPR